MAVLSCPHCGTVHIIVGGEPETNICTQRHCRGIMERQTGLPDISTAIRKAFYAHDHKIEAATVTADAP